MTQPVAFRQSFSRRRVLAGTAGLIGSAALAQDIALETSLHLQDAQQSLVSLGKIALQVGTPEAMKSIFHTMAIAERSSLRLRKH